MSRVLLSSRLALSSAVVVGLISGCAHTPVVPMDPGYVPRENPSGAAIVTDEDINRSPGGETFDKALASRFPGVWVTPSPNGGISVRIRGETSINGSNEPLYVIDGIAIQPGPDGALVGINPKDIKSIEVLKDAISTTMYGMRGANGVIVIKTKRPGQ